MGVILQAQATNDPPAAAGDLKRITQTTVGNKTGLDVNIIAGGGGGGGGTQYTEDVAAVADPVGTTPMLVRQDTPAPLVSANGDNVAQRATNFGAAFTQILSSTGSFIDTFGGGQQYTEGDTDTTITGTAIMFESNTGTSALSVVNNSTPLPISDAGGSLTIDASSLPLPTGASTAALQTQPGVDIGDVTVNNAAGAGSVNIQDGGNSITIDATSLPLPTGAATAALQTQPGVDIGDVTINNASGAGAVNIQDGGNSITVDGAVSVTQTTSPWVTRDDSSLVDNAGFTDGTSRVLPSGYIFDEVAGTALTENDVAASRIDSKRAQIGVIEDETTRGRRLTITAANAAKVDGSAVTQPVSLAAGTTSIGKAEDVASADADVGVPAMAVRKATPANTSGTDGDYEMLQMSAGRLWTSSTIDAAIPTGTNSIGDIRSITTSIVPGTAATNLGKAEDAGHTTGDTGVFILAVRNDNGATTFTNANSDYCPISVSNNGSLFLASVIPGTTTTELGKAEDQASADAHVGVAALAIRRDTPVANDNVSADGDYTFLKLDNLGKLWTAQTQTEDAAHASGDRGSFILGVRNTANTTLAGTDGDYAPVAVDIMSGPISGVRRSTTTLTAINTTYDDSPTSANSASVDCSMFRRGSFCAIVTESGTATDITFTLQFSNDGGTTWFDYRVGPWVKYRFDDATISAHASNQLKICEPFECVAPTVRMGVVGVGTDAANSFTVANATFELVN